MGFSITYNDRRLRNFVRERVLDLHHDGVSQRTIAHQLCASRRFVQNVLRDYDLTNSCFQLPKRHKGHTVLTPDAAECIEIEKICKPSIYTSELQNRLVLDGVLHPADLPHPSTITKFVRNELLMTKKKIHAVPARLNLEQQRSMPVGTSFLIRSVIWLSVQSTFSARQVIQKLQ